MFSFTKPLVLTLQNTQLGGGETWRLMGENTLKGKRRLVEAGSLEQVASLWGGQDLFAKFDCAGQYGLKLTNKITSQNDWTSHFK
jgi:hypothetical protein